jgi:hypothetical protein
MTARPLIDLSLWVAFAFAIVLATSPVWQRTVYGFNPTLDELLRVALCQRAPLVHGASLWADFVDKVAE